MADLDPTDYNGQPLVIVSVVFLVVTYLSIGLRVFVRVFILNTFSVDDWLMVVAQITFTLSCSFIFLGVRYGLGKHNDSLAVPARIEALKYQSLVATVYVGTMMLIKLSIAVFLLRIATKKRYTWTLKISMAVIAIWSSATILFNIFQCQPVASQWDFTITPSHCAPGDDFVNAAYAISAMTVISDWLYALLPIPMIWSVQMKLEKKLAVAIVLAMGVFASIATLIRIKYLVALGSYDDNLYTATPALVWTLVEPGVAITAASLITIRPLLRALNIRGFSSSSTRGNTHTNSRLPSYFNNKSNTNNNNSQTLHSRHGVGGKGIGGGGGGNGEGWEMKSWNHISAGGDMHNGMTGQSGGKDRDVGDRDGKGKEGRNVMQTDTTAVAGSDTGSEEYILRRDDTEITKEERSRSRNANRSRSRRRVREREREREGDVESLDLSEGIRRTVVVRIQSSPG